MDREVEEWRDIAGYEGYYQVSNFGRVRSLDRVVKARNGDRVFRGRVLKPSINKHDRPSIGLAVKGVIKTRDVHSLVIETFIGPAPEGMEGCHNDGSPSNNNLSNLRWDSRSGNMLDVRKHNGLPNRKGELSTKAKLKEKEVELIRVLLDRGVSKRKVSLMFKINRSQVSRIFNGLCWN